MARLVAGVEGRERALEEAIKQDSHWGMGVEEGRLSFVRRRGKARWPNLTWEERRASREMGLEKARQGEGVEDVGRINKFVDGRRPP